MLAWIVYPGKVLIMTVISKGGWGLRAWGVTFLQIRKLQVGITSPPLFDIVKSTLEAECRFHQGQSIVQR